MLHKQSEYTPKEKTAKCQILLPQVDSETDEMQLCEDKISYEGLKLKRWTFINIT